MAILIVAGGLLTLFALFPAGLRLSTTSLADMRQSMFSSDMLTRMQANAAEITDVAVWTDAPTFWKEITKGTPISTTLGANHQGANDPLYLVEGEVASYFTGGSSREDGNAYADAPARYKVRLHRAYTSSGRDQYLDPLTWRISMVVADQPDILFDHNPVYHLEVRYQGTP